MKEKKENIPVDIDTVHTPSVRVLGIITVGVLANKDQGVVDPRLAVGSRGSNSREGLGTSPASDRDQDRHTSGVTAGNQLLNVVTVVVAVDRDRSWRSGTLPHHTETAKEKKKKGRILSMLVLVASN